MADVVVAAVRTNVPDNLAMDGARDAVLQLEVHLGNRVLGEHRGVRDITCRNPTVSKMCRRKPGRRANVGIIGRLTPRKYVRIAADSTMLRMVNRLMALSLGVHREQLEHRMGLTWPRPAKLSVSNCRIPYGMQSEAMLTLLVAAVVLSLLDHLDGYLSVLVLKRVCRRKGEEFGNSSARWKTGAGVPHNSPPAIQHGPIWGPGQGPEETLKPTHQSADPHLAVWGAPKSSSPHKLRLNSFLRQAHLHNICSLLRKTLCLGTSARCCEPVALIRLALPFSLSTHHDTQSCSGRCCRARL